MNDDIVTRLREKYSGQLPICSEAADEIERLRAENETLKRLAFPRQNPEYRYFIHPDAVENYRKVIRGE